MGGTSFQFKTLMILSFLLIWAVVAAAHVFYYAVVKRDDLLAETRKIAWREARIPALRGRILDRNGVPAAWSELRHDLVLERLPESRKRRESLLQRIAQSFPETAGKHLKPPHVLKHALSPEEILFYTREFRAWQEVVIVPLVRRVVAGPPEIQARIGRTAQNNAGETVGVSGLEREYDLELSGRAGRMTVMLDRNGNWSSDTLRITRQPENGHDVIADFVLPDRQGNDTESGNEEI